ncbi:RNA polymerase small Zn-binding subunit [Basidiobolus meristosporus CBS 931.73]|uniref:RNA polymerase small Zn-binding subunit n=1 Tax=Basidiobolus meristosporus CBS 931.73 TaxID=1314790 RepID=A0A1Y1YMQ0_9FUNG|nr:RNA polymerase small Zn-binding subunit [Basidiobolus meristosporus CBS 931.73]|eukprot:ORX99248.1 RNA polymerase small Zn-binding subunit [Basidiobolus meristosporus CBS 931.73]
MNNQQYTGATGITVQPPKPMLYVCAECGHDNEIKRKEPIRCRDCGHRVLYKKRTTRMVQFEAR